MVKLKRMNQGLWATESAVISANGNEGILNKLWDKANNAKVIYRRTGKRGGKKQVKRRSLDSKTFCII